MLIKRSPELNLKILRTKPELINQLVDKEVWNEKDIYDYVEFLKSHPEVRQVIDAQIAQPINIPYLTQEDQQQIMTPLAQQKVRDPRFESTRETGEIVTNIRPKTPRPPANRPPSGPPPGPPPGRAQPPTSDRVLRSYTNARLNNDETSKRVIGPDDEEEQNWDEEVTSGGGIKNHVLPSTVPFGKIALDLNKLFYQNILSIKRHNGNKIIGHKNKRVSDNFVEIILKLFVENKPITQSDLKNIKDEQMLYDNLIVQSGLHKLKKIPTNIEQTSEQMKNRLGLITGKIEAGNSNKSLLTELHELLFKMVRVHLISKNAAAAYYKNIKDTFFTL